MTMKRLWHFFVGHRWRYYCLACERDPWHTYPASATWNCDCGASAEPAEETR